MKKVSVFMDVEDPINPLADDAALDLAHLFTGAGVRGSFCLTGEKCRTLVARDRQDVRDAYAPHCLGLHTDTHSFHPTTMELLADPSFEEGCELAFRAEEKGFDAFQSLFGRKPAFWGGAGNTWSPEIADAIQRLGIPAYAYALTAAPDQAVHRFHGVFALPQALSISEADWIEGTDRPAQVLQKLQEIPQPWVGIFVGHPTRFRYSAFWDGPYAAGRTPWEPEYTEPVPDQDYERAKTNLSAFLHGLQEQAKVVGVDDALAMSWRFRAPTQSEEHYFVRETAKNLRGAMHWPIHRHGLDPERIVEKTLALAHTFEIGEIGAE